MRQDGSDAAVATRLRFCRGRDCRRRSKAQEKLAESLPETLMLGQMSCQDVCDGPVVEVQRTRRFVFERVRGREVREALLAFVHTGVMEACLSERLVAVKKNKKKS